MTRFLLTVLAVLLIGGAVEAQDFTYGRGANEADASYWSSGDGLTHGSSANLLVYLAPAFNYAYRSVVRFDCSGDISGETIDSAKVTLLCTDAGGAGRAVGLYALKRVFDEATVDYDEYSSGNFWTLAGADDTDDDRAATYTDSVNVGSNTDHEFDVTADIQAIADGGTEYGWVIMGLAGSSGITMWFASDDATTASQRPLLEIWLASGVTETAENRHDPSGPGARTDTGGPGWRH